MEDMSVTSAVEVKLTYENVLSWKQRDVRGKEEEEEGGEGEEKEEERKKNKTSLHV